MLTGLFHRYITESGSALTLWAYRPRAAYASRAFQLGEYVGCLNDTTDSLVDCLRTIPGSDITDIQGQFNLWNTFPGIMWGPTDEPDIEGAFLTDSPINLLTAGKIRDLPWISGVTSSEGLSFSRGEYESDRYYLFSRSFAYIRNNFSWIRLFDFCLFIFLILNRLNRNRGYD